MYSKSGTLPVKHEERKCASNWRVLSALGLVVFATLGLGGCATIPSGGTNQADNGFGWQSASSQTDADSYTIPKNALNLNKKLPSSPLKEINVPNGVRTAATEAILQAISQLGTAYQWGGASKNGFDCSGLTSYVYRKADIDLPRTARSQYAFTKRIARAQLRPGDLLFFKIRSRKIDHVGIYVGDNRFIHAPRKGEHVKFARLNNTYWRRHFAGAGRVPGAFHIDVADLNALNQ